MSLRRVFKEPFCYATPLNSECDITRVTEVAVADPVGNLSNDGRQFVVGVDSAHAIRCKCDLSQKAAVQLPWSKHSDWNDLNGCGTILVGNGNRVLGANGWRPISYDDRDPRRQRSGSGASLEDLGAEQVESVGQVVAGASEVRDAGDSLLRRLAVVIGDEGELDRSCVAVAYEGDAQRVFCDRKTVDDEIDEADHLIPGRLALRFERRVDNKRHVDHRTTDCTHIILYSISLIMTSVVFTITTQCMNYMLIYKLTRHPGKAIAQAIRESDFRTSGYR